MVLDNWRLGKQEIKQKKTMRKGCYARTDLKKGEVLKTNNVIYLRPPNSLSPKIYFFTA